MSEAVGKRGRGRPRGRSARYAGDEKVLEAMADAILKDPRSNPTRAARQLGKTADADIKRLQRQFRDRRAELLEGAQKRRTASTVDRGSGGGSYSYSDYRSLASSYLDQAMQQTQTARSLLEREMDKVRDLSKLRDLATEHALGPTGAVRDMMMEMDRQVRDALATSGLDIGQYRANDAISQFMRREEAMNRRLFGSSYGRNRPWSGY